MNFIHIGMPLEHAVLLMNVSYEYEDLALKNIKIVNHIEFIQTIDKSPAAMPVQVGANSLKKPHHIVIL